CCLGLGREYALLFASRGAAVVVNDLGGTRSGEGNSQKAADLVVDEIRRNGGKAVANYDSVEQGNKIVKTAIDNFGRIGRSLTFYASQVVTVIKSIRIVMTSSAAGVYGNFGQTNYSSAKLGALGLSNTLAVEGAKYNIHCNTIIPVAASRLTQDILPQNLFEQLKPHFVAPLVVWLCHEQCTDSGGLFEAAGGWVGKYRWQRSFGKAFNPPESLNPESVRDNWQSITNMALATHPRTIHEQMSDLINSLSGNVEVRDPQDVQLIEKPGEHSYKEDDVILYALGVGVSTKDNSLKFLYENDEFFSVLPTYAVIPSLRSLFEFGTISEVTKSLNINFDPTKLLHGEQYMELVKPIPSRGVLHSIPRVVDVLDKGSGAVIIAEVETRDEHGEQLAYNQFSIFLVGSGNFGGKRMSDKKEVKNIVTPPKRNPDFVVFEKTSEDQAALYRLCGDKNPLHIDPAFAAVGGFNKPILHGLCSLGYATRHVLRQYANDDVSKFKAVKVRFSGTIIPGETIETRMWREGNRIHFESYVQETGKAIISGAYIDLITIDDNSLARSEAVNNQFSTFELDDSEFFVSEAIFEEIGRRIAMIPDVTKTVDAVFEFNISKSNDAKRVWTVDLKSLNGSVYEGHSKSEPPSCVLTITDEDMAALAMGMLNPVEGFMNGKIKIQGNPILTQKLQVLFEKDSSDLVEARAEKAEMKEKEMKLAAAKSNAPIQMAAHSGGGGPGGAGGGDGSSGGEPCIIDSVFENWLTKRLEEMQDLIPVIKTVYQWNILKNGKIASVWTCDFKNNGGSIYRGPPKSGKADCTLTLDDMVAARIFDGKEDAMKAFMSGKLKISGNILAAQKLQQLWAEEAPKGTSIVEMSKASNAAPKASPSTTASQTDPDLERIPVTGLKGDVFFNIFKARMHEEPDFMKRLRVIFQFNILKNGKPACIWTADNKTKNETQVYREPPKGVKPDCIVTVDDEDLLKIMTGKVNPQRLFMMGKVKVKGNIMLLQKLNSLWTEYQKLGKTPELPLIVDVLINDPLKPGLKSESTVLDLIQRIVRIPELKRDAPGAFTFDITKDGKVVSSWTFELKPDNIKVFRGSAPSPKGKIILADDDFAKLVLMKLSFPESINKGVVKCEGDKNSILKLNKLFTTHTSLKPKL
ncbi:peroxisomal multifunctional enzyme type 2-like isoform X1, partial [Leptotrombidium deliense]